MFEGSGGFSAASQPFGVLTEKATPAGDALIRERTGNRSLVVFDSGDEVTVQAGDEGIRFLLVSGKPIEEPVAWHGPIVMNTNAELHEAVAELRNGPSSSTLDGPGPAWWPTLAFSELTCSLRLLCSRSSQLRIFPRFMRPAFKRSRASTSPSAAARSSPCWAPTAPARPLINIICGIVTPSAGTVAVDGHDIITDYRAARSLIGLVPQELHTDMFETVWATTTFSRGLFGKRHDPGYVEKVLRQLSLWDRKDSKIMTCPAA